MLWTWNSIERKLLILTNDNLIETHFTQTCLLA